jgi:predicted nucleotide-binding protein
MGFPTYAVRASMKREKRHVRTQITPQGWRLIAKLACDTMKQPLKSAEGSVWKDNGTWGFETLDDFLANVNMAWSTLFQVFEGKDHSNTFVHLIQDESFMWKIEGASKAEIVAFEREAEIIISDHGKPIPAKPGKKLRVFIGHGRSADWRDLKDHLSDKHEVEVEAYETGSRAGHTIRDVLEDMMDASSLSILIHTPEDELADGTFNSRPNVIHETGLFQGRLGFSRAIVLLKDGTNEFSNLAGIQQIRYTSIRETYGEVLAWIKREQVVAPIKMK